MIVADSMITHKPPELLCPLCGRQLSRCTCIGETNPTVEFVKVVELYDWAPSGKHLLGYYVQHVSDDGIEVVTDPTDGPWGTIHGAEQEAAEYAFRHDLQLRLKGDDDGFFAETLIRQIADREERIDHTPSQWDLR